MAGFATDQPAFGQVRVASDPNKQGLFIASGGVRPVWLRHEVRLLRVLTDRGAEY